MGFFGASADSAVVEEVENATSDKKVEEDWAQIINICDKAGKTSEQAKLYLRTILKRCYETDPHIGLKAVTLLDACVKNAGRTFHIELASREFEDTFNKLMTKAPAEVARKLREALKRWAENEFKDDSQLSLIPSLYHKLRNTYDFSSSDTPIKKTTPKLTDPNVVESQEEEDQILKAIELSLKETSLTPKASAMPQQQLSLYPSVSAAAASHSSSSAKELRKVRALYDFEAAEDNELTFSAGEIIMVIDDSDQNWWKGSNQRGEGLFPANFVTADLSVEPEKFLYEKAKKMVQFKEEPKVVEKEPEEVEINEPKIDRLLHLLHEADPTNPMTDTDELLHLEREVNAMGPLIDSELERVDQKHAQLTQLSADLVEALGLYHTLMREPHLPAHKQGFEPAYGYGPVPFSNGLPPQPQPQPQHQPPQPVGGYPGAFQPYMGPPSGGQFQMAVDDRRMDMGTYRPGMPGYNMPPVGYHNAQAQPNGAQPQPPPSPYVSSSTHMMPR